MTGWDRIGVEAAKAFLNFSGVRPDDVHLGRVAQGQLHGAVALYNRLAERHLVWLADEVGMGKTYVALGVLALLRRQRPNARVLLLVPNARLQEKWRKELGLFTRSCVREVDHRARTLQDLPVRPLAEPGNLHGLAHEVATDPERDFFTTLSSFSFGLGDDPAEWDRAWRELQPLAPRLPQKLPAALLTDKSTFKRVYAAALNLILPSFDLVICDEAHNLRAGAGHGAARNLTLAAALGGRVGGLALPWADPGVPRVGRLLCLTATPVERAYAELARQAEVFGLDRNPDVPEAVREELDALRGGPGTEDDRKEIARRYVIRRLAELPSEHGEGLTKNQYRREWRQGGVARFDERLYPASPRERLLVALVQKRVIELLHETGAKQADGTFLPSFQMGMLSSFESFSETVANKVEKTEKAEPVYDGEEQTSDAREREGVDSRVVDRICRSYRETFGTAPPHPKMGQVAARLASWATAGEKALVFVRRVRSTEELADAVTRLLDERLIGWLREELAAGPKAEAERWFAEWTRERHSGDLAGPLAAEGDDDDDAGGADSFFAWFFRGTGTRDHQVAARLRRDTFQRPTHPWSLFFLDNHVLWLFGDDTETLRAWARSREGELTAAFRRFFPEVASPGPRHWYEGWQAAALEVLASESGDQPATVVARELRGRLYPKERATALQVDAGSSEAWLLREPFFTRLRRHPLAEELWPGAKVPATGQALHDRELRRELIGSTLRLGRPYVDLWVTAVNALGALTAAGTEVTLEQLADAFLGRLTAQAEDGEDRHDAWQELSALAKEHRLLVDVNFADARKTELWALTRFVQSHLSRQSPVVAMHGRSRSSQALTQFRMPGYPLVLVATDILQEGVDLHTFCARVVHFGISPTSSATEQRTGRIDRIGSLVHRRFREDEAASRLQVHYPHLVDTVEPLQLRELYRRMDLFLRLVHDGLGQVEEDGSRVSLLSGFQEDARYPAPPTGRLVTAFDVAGEDLVGGDLEEAPSVDLDTAALDAFAHERFARVRPAPGRVLGWTGEARVHGGARRQPVSMVVRTRRDGRGVLVRFTSPVGPIDLQTGTTVGALLRAQARLAGCTLVIEERGARRKPYVSVRCDVALPSGTRVWERLAAALERTIEQADALERRFLGDHHDLGLADWR